MDLFRVTVYLNNEPKYILPIYANTTIKQIKEHIRKSLQDVINT